MANWIAWIPIVLLVCLVPFAIWVRWQVRKIKREESRLGSENQRRPSSDDPAKLM